MALSETQIRKLEEEFNGEQLLQYERKRWGFFGLPFSFTKYYLTEKKLVERSGLLHSLEDEILLYRILDMSLRVSLGQKLFKLGTLELVTSDKSHPKIILKNIKNVRRFRNKLSEYVEKERLRLRFRTGEYIGTGEEPELEAESDLYS